MKMIIFLLLLVIGVAHAGPCGLTIRAENGRPCSDYIAMTGSKNKDPLTKEEFIKLNPNIDCDNPATKMGEGVVVCLYSDSNFDNPVIQEGTTFEAFRLTAEQLIAGNERSQFDKGLYNFLSKLGEQMGQRRQKREITDDLDKMVAEQLANPENIDSIKARRARTSCLKAIPIAAFHWLPIGNGDWNAVLARNENFKALDDEYKTWRPIMCQEMKPQQSNSYKKCVCDKTKPFIHCQAILVNEKENITKTASRSASQTVPQLKYNFPNMTAMRYSRGWSKLWQFIQMLQNGECQDGKCLSDTCFSDGGCAMIPGISIFSLCVHGGACSPNLIEMAAQFETTLPMSLFTDTKLWINVGFCLTEFDGIEILSWLGLEKCLASVAFDYYLLKSQLDVSGQLSLLGVRAEIDAKIQVAKSFSEGIGGKHFDVGDGYTDICHHPSYSCKDYCTDPGTYGIGYKVEYWWFGWQIRERSVRDAFPSVC